MEQLEELKAEIDTYPIKDRMLKVLLSFENNEFDLFIKHLILLRDEISQISPDKIHIDLVDFLMDSDMWSWVVSSLQKEPTNYDFEAAEFVAADLKDIVENDKIFVQNTKTANNKNTIGYYVRDDNVPEDILLIYGPFSNEKDAQIANYFFKSVDERDKFVSKARQEIKAYCSVGISEYTENELSDLQKYPEMAEKTVINIIPPTEIPKHPSWAEFSFLPEYDLKDL